jgi:hypothetical protein
MVQGKVMQLSLQKLPHQVLYRHIQVVVLLAAVGAVVVYLLENITAVRAPGKLTSVFCHCHCCVSHFFFSNIGLYA